MKKYAFLFLILVTAGCKNEPPVEPPKPVTLTLKAEDASCTEAWLKATTTETPATVALLRDNQRVFVFRLLTSDSLLFDEGLLPKHTYTYQLQKLGNSAGGGSASGGDSSILETSASVLLTTMDTTSHIGYTWSVDTLGVGNSSALFDIAIINDTLACAVGRMSLRDSSGQLDPIAYGLAVYNGTNWTLRRTYYAGNNLIVPIRGIAVAGSSDFWLAAGSIFHWDGVSSQAQLSFSRLTLPDPNGTIEKLWMSSSTSIFGVGNAGTVVRHNGSSWGILQSGTTMSLRDISGNRSGSNVWAIGYMNDLSRSIVLEYDGQVWRTVRDLPYTLPDYSDSLSGIMTSLWASSDRNIVTASDAGMYRFQAGSHGEGKRTWLPPPFTVGLFNCVRGTAPNNIFVVGAAGTVAHFNGVSWYQYQQFFSYSGQPNLLGLATKENTVIAVGYSGDRAVIIRGRK